MKNRHWLNLSEVCPGWYSAFTMIELLILTSNFSNPSSLQSKITVLFTLTLFLHNTCVVLCDMTYSSPLNKEVTMHVHGRPILPKSEYIPCPDLVDPLQLVTVLWSSKCIHVHDTLNWNKLCIIKSRKIWNIKTQTKTKRNTY